MRAVAVLACVALILAYAIIVRFAFAYRRKCREADALREALKHESEAAVRWYYLAHNGPRRTYSFDDGRKS